MLSPISTFAEMATGHLCSQRCIYVACIYIWERFPQWLTVISSLIETEASLSCLAVTFLFVGRLLCYHISCTHTEPRQKADSSLNNQVVLGNIMLYLCLQLIQAPSQALNRLQTLQISLMKNWLLLRKPTYS